MSKPDDWYPHYIADYAADTMHLTTVQHGAYRLLMDAYWRNQGPLDDDDDALAAITRLPLRDWRKMRPAIARFFQIDGSWSHKRIERELAKARHNSEQKSKAGKASAAAKQQQKVNGSSTAVATEDPTERQRQPNGAATPHSSPSYAAPSGAASDAATPAKRANAVRLALCEVFETDENRTPGWAVFGPISAWLEAGADPELDILPTARAMASRFAGKRPPASPAYLTNAVMEALQARRGIAAKAPALVVVDPAKEAAAQRFNAAMDAWIAGGRQGPMPVREPASDPLDIPKFLDRRTA